MKKFLALAWNRSPKWVRLISWPLLTFITFLIMNVFFEKREDSSFYGGAAILLVFLNFFSLLFFILFTFFIKMKWWYTDKEIEEYAKLHGYK